MNIDNIINEEELTKQIILARLEKYRRISIDCYRMALESKEIREAIHKKVEAVITLIEAEQKMARE